MKVLLDANAYSQLMRGRPEVAGIVRGAGELLMSTVVLGELLYGFRCGSRTEANIAEMRAFLENPYVSLLSVGPVTADRYSRIAVSLRAKCRPIPSNDVWIAAQAMETGADLVSADGHFEYVDGIAWVRIPATSLLGRTFDEDDAT
ncbi:type II toxin-antitoxin system VapC family toxin [Candidatus Palauibacter sp.]|uniref:type II toxin-antitoxin system VapC family toxin n=1 Tax=Candidatus Palauibacter sp. TaxID=3101350 RepID=UPI003B5A6B49